MGDRSGKGSLSDRYEILGAIHRGGMGEILLARAVGAEGFSRKLVLKGLLPQLVFDQVSLDLFRREARIMSRLEHPNIVRVVDFVYEGDTPYLAMEFVRGRNLHQVIQRAIKREGSLPMTVAAYAVAEALRGLHYAHHARDDDGEPLGIIHRDVSPGNILMSFHGEIKVTDFGIATATGAKNYTAPRSIRGKARYAAPEIVAGKPASIQSDIHSAGVVLAEALMGKPLFERGSLAPTLMAIVTERRDEVIDRIFDLVPEEPGLRAILEQALSLDPDRRYRTALMFADDLDDLTRELGGMSQADLGEFLCELFKGDADLPKDGGVIGADLPAMSFLKSREPKTEPSDSIPPSRPESKTPIQRPALDARVSATVEDRPRTVDLRPTEPPTPPPPRSQGRPRTRPRLPASAEVHETPPTPPPRAPARDVVSSVEREQSSASYLFSELVSIPAETVDEPSRAPTKDPIDLIAKGDWHGLSRSPWVLILIGIILGAATALTGSLIALYSQ